MRKIIAILSMFVLVVSVTVHADPAPECTMSMNDAYTIQGNVADITVRYDFNDTIHALLFAICFPVPLTVESVSVCSGLREMEGVMVYTDATEAGQVSVGILCASEGIIGNGELLTVRFRFADYYTNGYEDVDLVIIEALHDELGGESHPVQIDNARASVWVHAPTIDDVLTILRHTYDPITTLYAPWMDQNEDGNVLASDALILLRKVMGVI